MAGLVVASSIAMLGMALLWAAGWIQRPGPRGDLVTDHGAGPAPRFLGGRLVVMTWNIAYARGPNPDNNVNERPAGPLAEERLRRMGRLIREQGADVVFLQEVDFDAKRSLRVDQLARLAKESGLRYAARAVSWRAHYVPFPYWPPRQHYGRVLSGGGVLSRYPIRENRVLLHPKPRSQPWWYNLFYLFRYSQRVELDLGARTVWVFNNHLEAWDKHNRAAQARSLLREVQRAVDERRFVLAVGGDLNSVPPEARRKHGFPDEPRDDYRKDPTLGILRRLPGMHEIVPRARYQAEEEGHFTFPTLSPTRRLDYLFISDDVTLKGYRIVKTGDFSDHLPIVAELELDEKGPMRPADERVTGRVSSP